MFESHLPLDFLLHLEVDIGVLTCPVLLLLWSWCVLCKHVLSNFYGGSHVHLFGKCRLQAQLSAQYKTVKQYNIISNTVIVAGWFGSDSQFHRNRTI